MRKASAILALILLFTGVASGKKRDPLTQAEVDELRAVAMEPYKRLQLFIKFAGARLVAIDQLRADQKFAQGRGKKIHDLLEDFTAILDEINDNLDQYQGRPLSKKDREDFRKGLKEVIEAGEKFDLKLRALQSALDTNPRTRKEAADFQFVLQDAQEALKSSADMAREYLSDKNSNSPPPDVLSNQALGDYNAGKNDLAAQEFTQYLQVYGKSDLAGNAQFYMGEIDYRRGHYQAAIQAYNKVLDQYPGGNKGAAAQLKKGFALLELGQKDAGVQELRSLIARYPKSPEAFQARDRLAKLGAAGAASKGILTLSGADLSSLGA